MDQAEMKKAIDQVIAKSGSWKTHLASKLIDLSENQHPCDVTFHNRKPILSVRVDQRISVALMYGAGAKKLGELLSKIEFSDGSVANFGEIWNVFPMPKSGFTEDELNSVDMSQAEKVAGPNGETIRKMISDSYHCRSVDEEDHYLRRFLAS